jgi:hypothetical protein
MLTCEFCKKEYTTKSVLTHHIKTSKKCILLRGEKIESKELFNCEYCDFKTLTKFGLKSHLCKNKTEFEIKQENLKLKTETKKIEKTIKLLEKQIRTQSKTNDEEKERLFLLQVELNQEKERVLLLNSELNKSREEYEIKLKEATNNFEKERSKLEEKIKTHEVHLFALSSKATTTTSNVRINNVYNNLETLDLNEDKIRRAVEDNFTDTHFNDGVKGVARFTKDYILKTNEEGKTKYICSDTSRGIFKYLDENGLLQKDVKASRLKNSIQAPISKKSYNMFMLKLDEEENDKEIEVVHLNFCKIKNIDVNDYAKELALVV